MDDSKSTGYTQGKIPLLRFPVVDFFLEILECFDSFGFVVISDVALWGSDTFLCAGSNVPMPPELLELYQLYQQEVASRNEKEANYLTELNVMLRVGLVQKDLCAEWVG